MSSEDFAALIERRLIPYREAKVRVRVGVRAKVMVRVRVNPGP